MEDKNELSDIVLEKDDNKGFKNKAYISNHCFADTPFPSCFSCNESDLQN